MSRLKRLYQSLGPRLSIAIGAALVAAVAGAVVAIAASGSGGGHRGAVASVPPPTTGSTATSPPLASRRPGSKHHRATHRAKARKQSSKPHRSASKTRTTATTTTTGVTNSPTPTTPSPQTGSLTVALHGGGNATVTACAETHHYRTYGVGSRIAYSGRVTRIPSGDWKVKLKIKVCRGGTFIDYEKLDIAFNKHTGAFSGTFTAPPRGLYYVRADLYVGSSEVSESDHEHFKTH